MQTKLTEQLTMQLPNMIPTALLFLTGGSCICFIIIMILLLQKYKQLRMTESPKKPKWPLIGIIAAYSMILYTGVILIATGNMMNIMKKHGCENPLQYKKTISQAWKSIYASPKETLLPSNKNDILVIYYRFGCHDCELLYHTLKEQLNDVSDVYWIATRSKQGKQLRKQYPITDVPSGVAIKKDKSRTRILFQKQGKEIRLDTKNLTELTIFIKKGS